MIAEALFGGRLRAATKQTLGHPASGIIGWMGGGDTLSGVAVDENTALTYSACWAATRLLAGTEAWLPFNLYRARAGGGKEIAFDHPVHRILHDTPNGRISAMAFRAALMVQLVNAGNCFAEIIRTNGGRVVALEPIHWSRVTIQEGDDGLVYRVSNKNGRQALLQATDVFHVPSIISDDGVIGKGVIRHARESIGFGLGTERHGAAYFGNGARPSVLLKHPGKLSDQARINIRKDWKAVHAGPDRAGETAVLQEGMDAQILSISPEDSQFLQTRQHNIEEIARWYGVPPHKIQHLLRATFSNIESQGIEFVTDSLIMWLKAWEQQVWLKLLTLKEQETYYAKHVVDALLRGDVTSRTAALQKQFFHGALNQDEWREIEDRDPLPDGLGQVFYVPLNMTTAEKMSAEPEPVETIDVADLPRNDDEDEDKDEAARTAVLAVFDDVVQLMIRKEIEAAEQASRAPRTFIPKVEAFYVKHEQRMRAALDKPHRAVAAVLGTKVDCARLVSDHCRESRGALVGASDCSAAELPTSVAACIAGWPIRVINPLGVQDGH